MSLGEQLLPLLRHPCIHRYVLVHVLEYTGRAWAEVWDTKQLVCVENFFTLSKYMQDIL